MEKRKWLWIGGGIIFLVIFFLVGQQLLSPEMTAEAMTQEEAQKVVQEKYPGKVISVDLENDQYTIDIERDTGTYKVELDAKSGGILSLIRIGKKTDQSADEPSVDKPQVDEKEVASKEDETKHPNEQPAVEKQPTNQIVDSPQNSTAEVKKPVEKPKEELPKTLTENEAIQIARGQISGEIDGVELQSVNGISYYFVEVESGDDQEAIIQINAITGEVKSLTWED